MRLQHPRQSSQQKVPASCHPTGPLWFAGISALLVCLSCGLLPPYLSCCPVQCSTFSESKVNPSRCTGNDNRWTTTRRVTDIRWRGQQGTRRSDQSMRVHLLLHEPRYVQLNFATFIYNLGPLVILSAVRRKHTFNTLSYTQLHHPSASLCVPLSFSN